MSQNLFIVICINRRFGTATPSCAGRGSEAMANELERLLTESGLEIEVKRVKCLGQCEHGPNLRIAPGGRFYHHLSVDDLAKVITELQRLSQND